MAHAPTVSVIVPAFNVEQYLADAVRSAVRQTYTDLEVVITDDGSTDATWAIARDLAWRHPGKVLATRTENGGPSKARNAAIAIARGQFFALLDSDDIWEPEFLARQMAVFAKHPEADLVSGNGRFLGGARHGLTVRPCPDARPPITLETIITDEEAVFVMTVFRRSVHEKVGGFDESLRGNEDFDYWMRAALAGFRFVRNDEPLAWYRRRDDSLSADGVKMLRGALHVCRKLRPAFAGRPELTLLDAQIAYYEAEYEAARARAALASGDLETASDAVVALHGRRPSLKTAAAAMLARHARPVLGALYQLKRACRV